MEIDNIKLLSTTLTYSRLKTQVVVNECKVISKFFSSYHYSATLDNICDGTSENPKKKVINYFIVYRKKQIIKVS